MGQAAPAASLPAPPAPPRQVEERVKSYYKQLINRAAQEVEHLPFPS